MEQLTNAQNTLLQAIERLKRTMGMSPTVQELAVELGVKAPSVFEGLKRLEDKGYIRKQARKARFIVSGVIFILFGFVCSPANAQNVALLLFDAETSSQFAGCLNCNSYDSGAVCNRYGDYGSRYSEKSIWNRYGAFGSRYEENSPWNRYGEGLIVVDENGNFYGHFSLNKYAGNGQSKIPLVQSLLKLYEKDIDLDSIRDILCE